jgi:hypothetical protein
MEERGRAGPSSPGTISRPSWQWEARRTRTSCASASAGRAHGVHVSGADDPADDRAVSTTIRSDPKELKRGREPDPQQCPLNIFLDNGKEYPALTSKCPLNIYK